MKPIELAAFSGVRNDVAEERFTTNAPRTGLTDLSKAVNIELDETGKPYRRMGTTLLDATAMHSLWSEDGICLCVRGGVLTRVNPDLSFTSLGVAISNRTRYARVGDDVFLTDGVVRGVYHRNNGYRAWGVPVPTRPAISTTFGDLPAGKYLVSITFVRSNGLEGGAAPVQMIDVDSGAFTIPFPACSDPLVDRVNVYVSDTNGEALYRTNTLMLSDGSATISALPAARTVLLRTDRCGPPPGGQALCYYNGRVYVADSNYLWYTRPYEYELVHRAMNYIGFTSPIKTLAPVSDGLFVGSEDETVFLAGDEPDKFQQQLVAPYGTVLGTEALVPAKYVERPEGAAAQDAAMWMSKQGLCAGFDGGQMVNLTGSRYVLPEGVATGASLLKVRGSSPQLVTTLFS